MRRGSFWSKTLAAGLAAAMLLTSAPQSLVYAAEAAQTEAGETETDGIETVQTETDQTEAAGAKTPQTETDQTETDGTESAETGTSPESEDTVSVEEAVKAIARSGQFFMDTSSAQIAEGDTYTLKVARGGEDLPAASVRLSFIDISSKYGEDYTARLLSDAGDQVAAADADSTSILEQVQADPDAAVEIDAVDAAALTQEELRALYEGDVSELNEYISKELEAYAAEHPGKYVLPAGEESQEAAEGDILSQAFSQTTGLEDDNMPMSSDGKALLDIDALIGGYTADAVKDMTEELKSANLILDFAEGETEKQIEITALENDAAKGDLLFMAAILPESEGAVTSQIASFTGELIDNEKWEKPVISFTQTEFTGEEGYLTATLSRTGTSSQFCSVKLVTEDGHAVSGRDYSLVETEIFFPAGVEERSLRIPVRGNYLSEKADFTLKLSEAAGCSLGETAQAAGWVLPESGDYYETAGVPASYQGMAAKDGTVSLGADAPSGGGNNIEIDLSKNGSYLIEGVSEAYYDSANQRVHLMANDYNWADARAELVSYRIREERRPSAAYSGIAIDYEKTGGGSSRTHIAVESWSQGSLVTFNRTEDEKGRGKEPLYFTQAPNNNIDWLDIYTTHSGSLFSERSTLYVYGAELIPRPFEITASVKNGEELKFFNEKGELVGYDEAGLAGAGSFTLSGQSDIGVSTKYVGDTVTVNTDATYTYIKSLWLGDKKITADYPAGTKSVSYVMDEDFLRKYYNDFKFEKNGSKGLKGVYEIKVELGQYASEVNLHNDDERAELSLAFDYPSGADGKAIIHKGDYLAVRQSLKGDYSAAYTQSRIRIKSRVTSASPVTDTLRAFDEGSQDTCSFLNKHEVIDIYPLVEDKENQILVRVRDEDLDKFKTDTGVFAKESQVQTAGYHDYIVAGSDQLQAGTRYALEAVPADGGDIAVWQPAFKSTRYSQNTFWFEADAKAENNVILLSCEKADEAPYSLTGKVLYSNISLLSEVEGEAWMPASDAVVQITPMVYGLTDENGQFQTVPMKGISGCSVIYKLDTAGREEYRSITLRTASKETVMDQEAWAVPAGILKISPIHKEGPYVAAASLISGASSNGTIAYIGSADKGVVNTFTIFVYNDLTAYTDAEGNSKTEKVKDVQLYAYDPLTHEIHGQLGVSDDGQTSARKITGEGESRSIWQITADLREGEPYYQASDRIYVRLVTDREKGKAYDPDGNEIEGTTFSETSYPDLDTGFVLSASDSAAPVTYDLSMINEDLDLSEMIKLPILSKVNCSLVFKGMAFSIQNLPGNVHRFSLGKILNEHDYINDTGIAFNGFSDGVSKIKDFAKTVKGKGGLGVPGGGVYPFLGLYIDLGIAEKNASSDLLGYEMKLLGGGMYFGAQANYRLTLYLPVAIPVYLGTDGAVTAYSSAGFRDTGTITYYSMKDGSADLEQSLDMDFMFKAEGAVNAYAGVGLARTLGLRGGVILYGQYLYYPLARETHPDYHTSGFKITLQVRLWADVFLFAVPIPVYNLIDYGTGIFNDIEEDQGKESSAQGEVIMKSASAPSSWMPAAGLLRSAAAADTETVLQNGGYEHSSPQLLDMGEDGLLLVFLNGDPGKASGDQTTLCYSVYQNGTWSAPEAIGSEETLATGDFSPNLCDAGDSVMISWVSRQKGEYSSNLEYLGLMDVYTCLFDKATHAVTEIECLSSGDPAFTGDVTGQPGTGERVLLHNTNPVGIYDAQTGDRMVYYQKSEVEEKAEGQIDSDLYSGFSEEGKQLIANVSPTQNQSFIVYMLYDKSQGGWARDHVYENEVSSEEGRQTLINVWGGQRFLSSPIEESDWIADRPAIIDFNAISYNGAAVYAYTLDKDNQINTEYDRELFLQVYDFEQHKTYHPVRITNDSLSDARPQLVKNTFAGADGKEDAHTWLFWVRGASMAGEEGQETGVARIQYLDAAKLVSEGINDDGTIGRTREASEGGESGQVTYRIEDEILTVYCSSETETSSPNFSSYTAFVDKEDNLYVSWLQQPDRAEPADPAKNADAGFGSQEIFAAALIDRAGGSSWGDGVQLTDSGMINDEVALAVDGDNRLVTVGNQYTIDESGETGSVSGIRLTAVNYRDCGSLEAKGAVYSNEKPLPGESVTASVEIRNTGLQAASQGYEVRIYEVINGERSTEPVYSAAHAAGEADLIVPGHAVTESFEWTMPDSFAEIRTLSLYAEITEYGVEQDAVRTAELEGITIAPEYKISNVSAVQMPDGFYLSYEIRNEGNASFKEGDVTVRAFFHDLYGENLEETWIEEPLSPIGHKEGVHFNKKIEVSEEALGFGFANGYIELYNKNGEALAAGTDFIVAMQYPYSIVVNGDKDLTEIRLREGESLELTGSYAPASFYKNGKVAFSTASGRIAHMEGNTLVADQAGETTLLAFVDPFGGNAQIPIIVEEADPSAITGISLNTTEAELVTSHKDQGDSRLQLQAKILPETAADKRVTWSSSDESIATVDQNGLVTALRYGQATITATAANGLTAECRIQTRYYDVCGSPDKDDANYEYWYTPVYWAADAAITKGYDNVYFGPGENCLREQMITFLYRAAGSPAVTAQDIQKYNTFSDVDSAGKPYYLNAVVWAAKNGITKGYSSGPNKGKFGVGLAVSREDTVTFIYRMAGKPAYTTSKSFTDVNKGAYYYDAVLWAAQKGITNGYSSGPNKGKFGVGFDVLRKDIVTFLHRYETKVKN